MKSNVAFIIGTVTMDTSEQTGLSEPLTETKMSKSDEMVAEKSTQFSEILPES